MRTTRKLALSLASVGLLAGGLAATAPAAVAAETSEAGTQAAAALPGCWNIYVNDVTGSVQINAGSCPKTAYAKVIWAWGGDSACKAVVPGEYNNYPKPNSVAKFDRVERCA